MTRGDGESAGDDGDGWAATLAHHGRWLRRVLLARLGEPQAVEDVFQDVSLAAAAAARGGPPPANAASAWLYRVAVRQALLYRRRAGRRRRLLGRLTGRASSPPSSPPPAPPAATPGPLGWLLSAERDALVRAALERLPPRDAELLVLKYAEQWTYNDLAARLGLTHAAVEARLHRARRRLREELVRLAVDHEDIP